MSNLKIEDLEYIETLSDDQIVQIFGGNGSWLTKLINLRSFRPATRVK